MSRKIRLDEYKIRETATIRETFEILNRVLGEIALVVDESGRLIGCMTDGDARRALLQGATLASPIGAYMRRGMTVVAPEVGRAEVLDLMRSRILRQVPVVDGSGALVGLHLMRELIGATERENWAVIMAGGRGTRLRPFTENLPKPMISVAGRPILERILLHLIGFGIRRIFVSVCYLREKIQDYFGDGSAFGCTIEYLVEDEGQPLGSGGALSLLPETPSLPLLMLNGDLVTSLDLAGMLDFHNEGDYSVSIGVAEYAHTIPYGVVERDGDQVRELVEKPTLTQTINTGIYVVNPDVVSRLPRATRIDMPDVVTDAMRRGQRVGAYFVTEEWLDIGRPRDLHKAMGIDHEP